MASASAGAGTNGSAQGGHAYSNRLLQAKQSRKVAEADAQLLRNRIKLLEQEESRARKRIDASKKRAAKLLRLRYENEARLRGQQKTMEASQKEEDQRRRALRTQAGVGLSHTASSASLGSRKRGASRGSRSHASGLGGSRAAEETRRRKRKEAEEVKKQKLAMQKELARAREAELRRGQKIRQKIQREREQARKKREKEEEAAAAARERAYARKVQDEEKKRQQTASEVRKLEQKEKELIERLRNVQKEQASTFTKINDALTGQEIPGEVAAEVRRDMEAQGDGVDAEALRVMMEDTKARASPQKGAEERHGAHGRGSRARGSPSGRQGLTTASSGGRSPQGGRSRGPARHGSRREPAGEASGPPSPYRRSLDGVFRDRAKEVDDPATQSALLQAGQAVVGGRPA